MSHKNHRTLMSAAVAGVLATVTSPAIAQLETVIVTAERRETAIQDTPISIIAFTAEAMEVRGIETLEDVASFTPNLDIKGSRGTGNVSPTYQVRGLSGGGGATGERAVGMYLDGIYLPRTTGPFMNVLEIERIEVLRGPQGTLFGRNSTGGAIRVFTKQPGPEFDSFIELGFGSDDRQDLNAMVNVPLSDTVFLRAQGASLNQDGYVRRGPQLLGGSEDTMLRLQLGVEPSDELQFSFSFTSSKSESEGNPQDLATFDMRPGINFEGGQADWVSDWLEAAGEPRIDGTAFPGDPRIVLDSYSMPDWCFIDDLDPDWDPACTQFNDGELTQLNGTIDWAISDNVTLTSVTGVSEFESHGVSDWVMLGQELRASNVESDVFYQELQINTSFANGQIDFVGGFSYFQEDSMGYGVGQERRGTSVFPDQPNGNGAMVGSGPNGVRLFGETTTWQDSESFGIFANLTWHVTERLNFTPGLRFSDDEKSAVLTRRNSDDYVAAVGTSSTMTAGTSSDEMDFRFTIDYDISDSHMIYGTRSKSYRAGAGVILPRGGIPADPTDLQAQWNVAPPFTLPESVINEEIGVRTEWLDGRLRLNLSYYDMVYGDRQAPVAVVDPTSPVGFFITVQDSGNVDLDGFEFDGQFAVTDNLFLDFSAGSLDFLVYDVCGNNGANLFPGPVEDSYTLGIRGFNDLTANRQISWSLSYANVGEQETHPGSAGVAGLGCPSAVSSWFTDSAYRSPSYGLLNGRVTFTNGDGSWSVSLFGNNLTDEVYANFSSRFGGGFWEASPAPFGLRAPDRSALGNTMGRPREYGVEVRFNFAGT